MLNIPQCVSLCDLERFAKCGLSDCIFAQILPRCREVEQRPSNWGVFAKRTSFRECVIQDDHSFALPIGSCERAAEAASALDLVLNG